MKYYELQKDEEQTLKEYEKGAFTRVKDFAQQRRKYMAYAQATLAKTRNVNIRVPEKDLLKVKSRAAEKGIPYQTLLASLIHQYSTANCRTGCREVASSLNFIHHPMHFVVRDGRELFFELEEPGGF